MSDTESTILIVDDDEMIRGAMSRALTQAGYAVSIANDGKEGLEIATSSHPKLIILDYNMPKMNGLKMLESLRKDGWGHGVQVIFATNIYDLEAMNVVMGLGVSDYVMKSDIAIEDLIRLVNKYVSPTQVAAY